MTREELITRTRQLIYEGERLLAQPSLGAMQLWLQLSDDLLKTAWGSMDRYHLAWLMVGKPKGIVHVHAKISDGVLDVGVAEQDLHGAQVTRRLVNQ